MCIGLCMYMYVYCFSRFRTFSTLCKLGTNVCTFAYVVRPSIRFIDKYSTKLSICEPSMTSGIAKMLWWEKFCGSLQLWVLMSSMLCCCRVVYSTVEEQVTQMLGLWATNTCANIDMLQEHLVSKGYNIRVTQSSSLSNPSKLHLYIYTLWLLVDL